MSKPRRIDFVISNPGHHLAQITRLFGPLQQRAGVRSRVLSLCELRGFATPAKAIRAAGADCQRLVPPRLRRSPGRGAPRGAGGLRRWSRRLGWLLLLSRPLAAALREPPSLVVLPNDAAFPYDRLADLLRRRRIPFVLLQEGIRFPLPTATSTPSYGAGGALAVAAWGETSAEYFRRQGVAEERIWLTGSPRFDDLPAARPRPVDRGEAPRKLLLLTNPIDDQGFCNTAEKLALFRRFVEELKPLMEDGRLELWVRPHGRESSQSYLGAIADLPQRHRVQILAEPPLYTLLAEADAVVVTATTAGLEALLFGLPLGVLEIPGFGFVYDYVASGAALGLDWQAPMAPRIARLIEARPIARERIEAYLARSLATLEDSSALVTDLLLNCAGQADAATP